jgi:hypothetical protein
VGPCSHSIGPRKYDVIYNVIISRGPNERPCTFCVQFANARELRPPRPTTGGGNISYKPAIRKDLAGIRSGPTPVTDQGLGITARLIGVRQSSSILRTSVWAIRRGFTCKTRSWEISFLRLTLGAADGEAHFIAMPRIGLKRPLQCKDKLKSPEFYEPDGTVK